MVFEDDLLEFRFDAGGVLGEGEHGEFFDLLFSQAGSMFFFSLNTKSFS